MTTPPSPPTPPSPSDSRWHTVGIIVAAVITAAATVTAGLMSADSEKSGPEAASSSGRTSAPAQAPTPIATPTPTPTPTPSAISTPPSTPEPAPTPTPAQPLIRSEGLPPELAGTWVGVATESDSDSTDSYRVRLELTGGAVTENIGEVHYEMQGSRCQGDLTLWAVDAGSGALSLGEYIESGNCVKGGRITLTPMPDGTLDFAYTGAKVDGSEQSVHAGLEKVR